MADVFGLMVMVAGSMNVSLLMNNWAILTYLKQEVDICYVRQYRC